MERPTEQDGRIALRDHLLDKAAQARARLGGEVDGVAILRILDDKAVVRYPTGVRFDAGGLRPGEFAHACPLGEHPRDGFCIFVHPCFHARPETWAALIAYHLPPINYGDIVTPEDCEQFGAALLGMDPDTYYRTLCTLADSIPAPHAAAGNQP